MGNKYRREVFIDIEDVFMATQPKDHRAQQILENARRAANMRYGDPDYAKRMQERAMRNMAVDSVLRGETAAMRREAVAVRALREQEERRAERMWWVQIAAIIATLVGSALIGISLIVGDTTPEAPPSIDETANPYE